MIPRTLTSPLPIRGDVPGLLCRGMPVYWQRPDRYGIPTLTPNGMCGIVTGTEVRGDSEASWAYAAWATGYSEDVPVIGLFADWSSPLAIYAALHWLSARCHDCWWMRPTEVGGRTADWNEAAILVSVSVGRVVTGKKPVPELFQSWRDTGDHFERQSVRYEWMRHDAIILCARNGSFLAGGLGWNIFGDFSPCGPETGDAGKAAADAAALSDGAALRVEGGVMVGVVE